MSQLNEKSIIITVDGPSASGKGTVCRLLSQQLGYHLLDSGALYRIVAWAYLNQGSQQIHDWMRWIDELNIVFDRRSIFVNDIEVTHAIRQESIGVQASVLAKIPQVRQALLEKQRRFPAYPGLVADGRDMGSVVFPQADLKIFLEADVSERAKRRHLELTQKGVDIELSQVLKDLQARDDADRNRPIAPLVPAQGAWVIDGTFKTPQEIVSEILQRLQNVTKTALF